MAKFISFCYRNLLKPILFRFEPEFVHNRFTFVGRNLGRFGFTRGLTRRIFRFDHPKLAQEVLGLRLTNPVVLSAGFDKQADMVNILPSIGFSGMEMGSITWKPYSGNAKPRLYRLPKSKAIVVYYGLKNLGVVDTIVKFKKSVKQEILQSDFQIGISIAKTNSDETCTVEAGIEDYYQGLKSFVEAGIGDYYTINISCPNTFGGEPFTTPDKLSKLLGRLATIECKVPIFVKMPINLDWTDFRKLIDVVIRHKIKGVIIGNLNKNHQDPNILEKIPEHLKGGISGKPTFDLSNALIEKTYRDYGKKLVIVGTGGIFKAEDAYKKIKLGATFVQMITGMIFEGPQVIGEINRGLLRLIERDGYKNISDAIGVENKQ